jgi:hypothetical protein
MHAQLLLESRASIVASHVAPISVCAAALISTRVLYVHLLRHGGASSQSLTCGRRQRQRRRGKHQRKTQRQQRTTRLKVRFGLA